MKYGDIALQEELPVARRPLYDATHGGENWRVPISAPSLKDTPRFSLFMVLTGPGKTHNSAGAYCDTDFGWTRLLQALTFVLYVQDLQK
jgi:hypothetical protein